MVIVTGTPGAPEFETEFRRSADLWADAATKGPAEVVRIGERDEAGATDKDRLRQVLDEKGGEGAEPLWLVLIGHGTFDRRDAKFNLRGPDLSDVELAAWLGSVTRPIVVVNGASSSGPFVARLSGKNRVIVTATRSGDESNFARFGGYLAAAIGDEAADLDKDGQVSLLEAYLTAAGRVEEFYKSDARLATEHALLDDNGDGLGTPPDWFHGIRAVKRAKDGATLDGVRAHQLHLVVGEREREMSPEARHRRDELELAVAMLREKKEQMPEDEYYARLEELMLELARLYREAGATDPKAAAAP